MLNLIQRVEARNSLPRFFRTRLIRAGWVVIRRSDGLRKSVPVFRRRFVNGDPLRFVIDHNLHRRHLNETQRAMIGAQITTSKVGGRFISGISEMRVTNKEAADLMNVGKDSITSAKTLAVPIVRLELRP